MDQPSRGALDQFRPKLTLGLDHDNYFASHSFVRPPLSVGACFEWVILHVADFEFIEHEGDPSDEVSLDLRVPKYIHDLIFTDQNLITFALIDPQIWENTGSTLVDSIAEAGLTSAPLFQGDIEEEDAELLPTLVELQLKNPAQHRFVRQLFTIGWELGAGIVFRSTEKIGVAHAGLRKLTLLRDEDTWYFNRFWEPEFFLYFANFMKNTRLFNHLGFAHDFHFPVEGVSVQLKMDWEGTPEITDHDDQLDLVFAAGAAMVGIRHIINLNEEAEHPLDQDQVFGDWSDIFGEYDLNYAMECQSIEIVYTLRRMVGTGYRQYLQPDFVAACFNPETGDPNTMFRILHGACMFGYKNHILPTGLYLTNERLIWQHQHH